ncbi:hypothetical protein RCC89_13635 [Cytophagaceae bacterium ABcell3]|nr:hypothetical protein RCC89_13635 [Cytophagaceae bacterium ABcell3]
MKKISVIIVFAFLVFLNASCTSLLGIKTKSERPVSNVSVVKERYICRNIDVSRFKVSIVDGQLNLFKNNGLIQIEIEGTLLLNNEDDNIYFKKFKAIEKVISNHTLPGCKVEIELIPVFSKRQRHKDKTFYSRQENGIGFRTALQHRLYSGCFGSNDVSIRFIGHEESFIIYQGK